MILALLDIKIIKKEFKGMFSYNTMNENKYINGKIYRIVDTNYSKCYVGSTCESSCKRLSRHKNNFNVYGSNATCRSRLMFIEFGLENCKIELIEKFPCNDKEELHAREGYHTRYSDIECVNKKIMGRTDKQYQEDNKEKNSQTHKDYYIKHADKIKENAKQYRENNKDKTSKYFKERYEQVKDEWLQPVICECGCTHCN